MYFWILNYVHGLLRLRGGAASVVVHSVILCLETRVSILLPIQSKDSIRSGGKPL